MSENKEKPKPTCQKYSPQFKDQALERALKDGVAQTAPAILGETSSPDAAAL